MVCDVLEDEPTDYSSVDDSFFGSAATSSSTTSTASRNFF